MAVFLEDLSLRFDRSVAVEAAAILEELRLPVPRDNAYVSGKESVFVPLNPYGLMLRFGERAGIPVCDEVLQPAIKIDMSERASFEMLPGIRVGGLSALGKFLIYPPLIKAGLHMPYSECIRSNIGHITDPDTHKEHFLVLDRNAASPSRLQLHFHTAHDAPDGAPIQAMVFGELYRHGSGVIDPVSGCADMTALRGLMSYCNENSHLPASDPARVLYADWTPENLARRKSIRVKNAAQQYEQQLRGSARWAAELDMPFAATG